ncbi:glucose PTS transporter subunit EIIB [Amycolatopsis alkalitolerans]|uniref:PTS sugar transporter n=1 Tax=Amycolatopsis alkalitolerans TaxID=2547244 RepID=A0A5C4M3R0_9PSEU|nr:PTS glucose/sucrose transporter subunit IIB [Amycolatopsis alkalitolerans]TNC27026.1 PTS sugar transporter [Amycolatopsis alkalitolerans]
MLRTPLRCQPPLRERVQTSEKEAAVADDRPEKILAALGGADNIIEIEGCITRLRCELEDGSVVDEAALKKAGAHGVMKMGAAVQVIVGPEADTIASDIQDLL